jgi:DNA polymerase-3 subunit epsilon
VLQAHKPTLPSDDELEAMADALAASGQYRIQRRLRPRPKLDVPAGTELRQALFVDVETTGLDHQTDEIIELAMVPFTYGPDGLIYEVKEPFQRFNQPSKPISAEISRLSAAVHRPCYVGASSLLWYKRVAQVREDFYERRGQNIPTY